MNHIIVLVLLSDDNPEHDEPMFQDLGHAFVRYNLQQHDITNNPHAHTHTSERRPYFKLSKTTILVTLLQVTFTAAHSLTGITILMIWSDQQC